jgi:hypothetical protein
MYNLFKVLDKIMQNSFSNLMPILLKMEILEEFEDLIKEIDEKI